MKAEKLEEGKQTAERARALMENHAVRLEAQLKEALHTRANASKVVSETRHCSFGLFVASRKPLGRLV